MEQDLRELMNKSQLPKPADKLPEGHEIRFEKRLDMALPKKSMNPFFFMKIAAAILVLVATGFVLLQLLNSNKTDVTPEIVDTTNENKMQQSISLGDLSPNLKKVEDYYVANINYELSQLDVSDDNKEMVDGFMERLGELDEEYDF